MSSLSNDTAVGRLMAIAQERDPEQSEFLAALEEVLTSLAPVFESDPKYERIMERLIEPERLVQFRVVWSDDEGQMQVNRGWRVQYNSALGPYKGGLRFHPSVKLSILKFLAFEQTFKNSLTQLPMGGGKGGSDFDPRGKSDGEVMRFCQSFMTELHRHIGPNIDVPAGDIGVGGREVGYMFGQYKRLTRDFSGVITGKGLSFGGSRIRPEATGYGLVYFANEVLTHLGDSFEGKRCVVSGSGNVAQYCAEKLLSLGAVVLTMSDSKGYVYQAEGITREDLDAIFELKQVKRGRISEYATYDNTAVFVEGSGNLYLNAADYNADFVFPCATQNEIDLTKAQALVSAGIKGVFEGANMPSTNPAIEAYKAAGMLYSPAKASNAGGVAVSGLEMSQNSERLQWTEEEVDDKLKAIMKGIHENASAAAAQFGMEGDLQAGANIAGFLKVADAMEKQGWV